MNMPRIGDRIVVTAWAVREEVQCGGLVSLFAGIIPTAPEQVGLIWVPIRLPKPVVCVCVGWVRKGEGVLHTKVEERHKRFTATSWLRFPRVVLKANGPIRLAYTWRAF